MKRKNIDLDQSVIDALSIQAINTGKKNFKNYVEFLLSKVAVSPEIRIKEPMSGEYIIKNVK